MRRLVLSKTNVFVFVFVAAILGYPSVAGFATTFELKNRLISIVLNTSIALAALFLLIDGIGESKNGWRQIKIALLSLFFVLYFTRVYVATFLQPYELSQSWHFYWIWGVGGALLPALGLAVSRNRAIDWSAAQRKFLVVAIIGGILVAANLTTTVTNAIETYDSGRARLETLNPISLGHFGASILLVSLALLITGGASSTTFKLTTITGFLLGGGILIAANSRGPIVAAVAALFFGWFSASGRRRLSMMLFFVLLVASFVPILILLDTYFGSTIYSRFFEQSISEDVSASLRLSYYGDALSAIYLNPFFGGGLEVSGIYPHNVTLEAFMATGMFGGAVFLILEIMALQMALRASRRDKNFLWVGMLAVQYMVGAQFSGAIYSVTTFWVMIGVLTFASASLLTRESCKESN